MAISFVEKLAYINKYAKGDEKLIKAVKYGRSIDKIDDEDKKKKIKEIVNKAFDNIKKINTEKEGAKKTNKPSQAVVEAKQKIDDEIEKFKKSIGRTKWLTATRYMTQSGLKKTTIEKDAKVGALPKGKRISRKTGKPYWENRANRSDVKQPPVDYPKLAKGGEIGKFNGKPFSFYKYDTKKVKIAWKGKIQPFGAFYSVEDAIEELKKHYQTQQELREYSIVTPDGIIHYGKEYPIRYAKGGGVGSYKSHKVGDEVEVWQFGGKSKMGKIVGFEDGDIYILQYEDGSKSYTPKKYIANLSGEFPYMMAKGGSILGENSEGYKSMSELNKDFKRIIQAPKQLNEFESKEDSLFGKKVKIKLPNEKEFTTTITSVYANGLIKGSGKYSKLYEDKYVTKIYDVGGEFGSNYEIELFWKGLKDDKFIGKYIVSNKTLDNLEEEYAHALNIDVLDESNAKAISYYDLKKKIYAKGKERGFFAEGGEVEEKVEISNFRRNILGTLSFDLKLKRMRKPQDFVVYPAQEKTDYIIIQSNSRFGKIEMSTGRGLMSQSHPNGAYVYHYQMDKKDKFQLSDDQLSELKKELAKTAGSEVGIMGVISDNTYANQFADGGQIGSGKNGYVAFYKGKRIEVYADTMYQAQQLAAKHFKAKKEWEVNVVLAEVDGKPYIQSTAFAKGGNMEGASPYNSPRLKPKQKLIRVDMSRDFSFYDFVNSKEKPLYNLFGVRNGKEVKINKNPMSEKEADEMYDDAKKSGLYSSLQILSDKVANDLYSNGGEVVDKKILEDAIDFLIANGYANIIENDEGNFVVSDLDDMDDYEVEYEPEEIIYLAYTKGYNDDEIEDYYEYAKGGKLGSYKKEEYMKPIGKVSYYFYIYNEDGEREDILYFDSFQDAKNEYDAYAKHEKEDVIYYNVQFETNFAPFSFETGVVTPNGKRIAQIREGVFLKSSISQ